MSLFHFCSFQISFPVPAQSRDESRETSAQESQSQAEKKPLVTVRTQLKQKQRHLMLDIMKPSTKEAIKKTLSDPASRVRRQTAVVPPRDR